MNNQQIKQEIRDLFARVSGDYDPTEQDKAILDEGLDGLLPDETGKPSAALLALAQRCGAVLTGKPDGSEPIEVIFSVAAWRNFDAALQVLRPDETPQHSDDKAVDEFAQMMKKRLAAKRGMGKAGWDDPAQCTIKALLNSMHTHSEACQSIGFVGAARLEDVANYAMMARLRIKREEL